jgi:hypothetical protein
MLSLEDGTFVALGLEAFQLEIKRAILDEFDKLIDDSLEPAIQSFLDASENPKYFLVEYYKCMEVIKKGFGGQTAMLKALEPYGFSEKMFDELNRTANNPRKPLSFARHAAQPGANIHGITGRCNSRTRNGACQPDPVPGLLPRCLWAHGLLRKPSSVARASTRRQGRSARHIGRKSHASRIGVSLPQPGLGPPTSRS